MASSLGFFTWLLHLGDSNLMRATVLNQFYAPELAPTGNLAASLAEHRAELGDEVTVVTSRGGYVAASNIPSEEKVSNPRVYRAWTPRFGKKRHIFRIIDYAAFYVSAAMRLLTLRKQDVIITLTTPPLIGLAAVLHKCLHPRTKIVLWNMDCYPDVLEEVGMIRRGGIASRLLRMLVRFQFRFVNHLVTLDDAMRDLLLSQYAPRNKPLPTTTIPNWEPASLFADGSNPSRWSAAQGYGLQDRFTILYLGNTGYGHAFDTVLEAAARMRDQPVTFLFVGGGARWREIEQAKEAAKLDNVVLHGYVSKEETPAVMAAADVALITLHDWSLGIMSPSKLHSNLAMGLPVIYLGPQRSNVDEAIVKYQCGISLRHKEVQPLIDFIRRCINDPEYRQELSTQARHAFESSYCDRQTLGMFDRVLADVTRDARTPEFSAAIAEAEMDA